MGFWEQFPYMNTERLNLDYILKMIKECENLIKNLDKRIETVVRPMINSTETYIQSYYNKLNSIVLSEVAAMTAANQNLDNTVTRRLNENMLWVSKIDARLSNQTAKVERDTQTAISNLRNDTNTLIMRYDAIWGANAVNQNSHVNRLIKDFTEQYNEQLENNRSEMVMLKNEVDALVDLYDYKLNQTINQVSTDLSAAEVRISKMLGDNIDELGKIKVEILSEMEHQALDIRKFYDDFYDLFNDTFALFNERLDYKADIVYVDAEIQKVIELIKQANGNILVVNPVTQRDDTLQNTLDDIYNNVNPWSLTAIEYDNLYLTAEEYERLSGTVLTAWNYDYLGRYYLLMNNDILNAAKQYTDEAERRIYTTLSPWISDVEETNNKRYKHLQECCKNVTELLNTQLYMNSPFTGMVEPLSDVILSIVGILRTAQSVTASEYDNLMLTVQSYDDRMISAYDYDWNGKILLTA